MKVKNMRKKEVLECQCLFLAQSIPKGKTVYDGLVNQLDFFPTILDLTDTKIPAKYTSDLDGLDVSRRLTKY